MIAIYEIFKAPRLSMKFKYKIFMKIKAYRCDYCGTIQIEDNIVGILDIADLFNSLESFPSHKDPERCRVHHCLDCSRQYVVIAAENKHSRKHDERLYQLTFKELYYLFKSRCVSNVQNKVKIFVK